MSDAPSDLEATLVDALARLTFAVQHELTEVAAEQDLSLTQLRVVAILRDRSVAMAELAGHLGLDRSSVSGLIDRAERRGLVERAPRPEDGRGVAVRLTERGRDAAGSLEAAVTARLRTLTRRLGARDRATLVRLVSGILPPD